MTILADPGLPPRPTDQRQDRSRPITAAFCTAGRGRPGCTEAVAVDRDEAGTPGRQPLSVRCRRPGWLHSSPTRAPARGGRAATWCRVAAAAASRPSSTGSPILPILPRITLLIVGGGHVGQAVARLAAEVDFDIWVLDDRDRYASRGALSHGPAPPGRRHRRVTLKELVGRGYRPPSIYCLIVTRGHGHDEEALYHLATDAGRLRRHDRQQAQDQADLRGPASPRALPAEAPGKVHAPLGLTSARRRCRRSPSASWPS